MLYDLYAGMGGGFGGATYQTTEEFATKQDAENEAYLLAREIYESYEGSNGILSWDDCLAILEEEYGEVYDDEVHDYYLNEVESWICYHVEVHDDENPPEY
jgi:intein/homing endonuclease